MRKLLFLAAGLLAGCRSEQVAFQFRPASSASWRAAAAPRPADQLTSARITTTRLAAPAAAPVAPLALPPSRPRTRRGLGLKAQLLPPPTQASVPGATVRQLARLRPRPTEGPAEAGLGRVALFFIGVTLAVLAGLAALVNVIFSVGFFTALGYTAAGLVVLGLLYLLLSGHQKKV